MSLVKMINALINDIGTGISEADIKGRLLKLRQKVEAQEARLKDLKAEIVKFESQAKKEKLAPKQYTLNKTQLKFLKILFRERECSLDYIASELGLKYGMAEYHANRLCDIDMIRWTGRSGDFGEGSPGYELTTAGNAYLIDNRLVS